MQYKVKMRSVDELKEHPHNSKLHPHEQVKKIAASIREFGFTHPILINDDDYIVAGHGRVLAAKELALSEVPTLTLSHLDENQQRAYLIADNKTAESGYNLDILNEEIFDLASCGFDASDLGFDTEELEKLMKIGVDDEEDAAKAAEQEIEPKSGDVWKFGQHELVVCGRRVKPRELLKSMHSEDRSMTLYLTDRQAKSFLLECLEAGLEPKLSDSE